MVKISTQYARATNFAVLVIAMVAWIAGLASVLYLVLTVAARNQYLLGLAWLTMGLLAVSLILLVGIIVHYITSRINQPAEPFEPTKYEDAWTEAGRRLKPEDAPPVDGFEEDAGS